MNYDRDEYMRRQEADIKRAAHPTKPRNTRKGVSTEGFDPARGKCGSYESAVTFTLDVLPLLRSSCSEPDTFLRAWREGDLDEWPEFASWMMRRSR